MKVTRSGLGFAVMVNGKSVWCTVTNKGIYGEKYVNMFLTKKHSFVLKTRPNSNLVGLPCIIPTKNNGYIVHIPIMPLVSFIPVLDFTYSKDFDIKKPTNMYPSIERIVREVVIEESIVFLN